MIGFKFLAAGARAPFTRFRWPSPGSWVSAPEDRAEVWIHACRRRDLPYWLDDEPGESSSRSRCERPATRSRLDVPGSSRVGAWDRGLMRDYARACALRARAGDAARPQHGPRGARRRDGSGDHRGRRGGAGPTSRAAEYVADAANNALHGPATTSYIAAMLASSLGGGLAAFEAERAWQARWIGERLALEPAGPAGS